MHYSSPRSTAHVPPSVVQVLSPEPDVPRKNPEPENTSIPAQKSSQLPYPSRMNDEKLKDKNKEQMEKIFQIFN
ncbi:hypothetical protein, partial [Salmonella enterica]|uniref:hypothetical protein n=1 Tax=Salmonella enterica TaxID=28901 RepID=UPI0020C5056F